MPTEGRIIALVTIIQFIYIVDFMMVIPLGPDFAMALGIDTSKIGWIAGSYTLASAVVALLAARFLDRFDRKPALVVSLIGLSVSTLLAAYTWDLESLVGARVLAGICSGPLTALAMSVLIDVVPEHRRGRAIAFVMASFSAAAVVGVPFGLELARWINWQAPFVFVAASGAVVTIMVTLWLPSMKGHLDNPKKGLSLLGFLRSPIKLSMGITGGLAMFSGFLIIPHLSTYFQFNLGYPREYIGMLYMAGGSVSFLIMQIAGRSADRFGVLPVAWIASALLISDLALGFVWYQPIPIVILFIAFMGAMTGRNISVQTLASKVPKPHERAGFMAIVQAMQHFSSGGAAIVSAAILSQRDGGALMDVPQLGLVAIGAAFLVPLFMTVVQVKLRKRGQVL